MKICPKNLKHREFMTVAVEMHDWLVDGNGNFIEDKGCTEMFAKPDSGNVWSCATCGEEAMDEEEDEEAEA